MGDFLFREEEIGMIGVRDTFDLLNCGPNNRFTVSDKLVHNCGFGGGVDAIIRMSLSQKIEIHEDILGDIHINWRKANPKIVKMWKAAQRAAVICIETGARIMLTDISNYNSYILVSCKRY